MPNPIFNPTFQRRVIHLYALGRRPVGEALLALARLHDAENDLAAILEDYQRLSPDVLEALNGRDFSPTIWRVS